jgi:ATP-dependent helicase/nuclease subunit A
MTDTNNKNEVEKKASDTGKSVHLSASAGSGKTRALKNRYLALLDSLDTRGLNIDQAVAITFTDKAAAEIKERVMHDIPEAMLKKIIRGRQDLRISTIHSFCMNLLKRYPLEAGLPPDFEVVDARDQAYKIQNAIDDALEESDRFPGFMTTLRNFTADELAEMIEFLLSIRSRLKRMEIDLGGPAGLMRAIGSGMGVEQAEAEIKTLFTSTGWRSSLQHMAQILKAQSEFHEECKLKKHIRLAETRDADSAFRISQSLASIYFTAAGEARRNPYIARKAFTGQSRSEYEQSFFHIQDMLVRLRNLHARIRAVREATGLLQLFQLAENNYKESKLREGLLDFDDLEISAYGLLQGLESQEILYWLDRKILHFLVDEFQDTSDIQWAILNKLTEELFAGQGADWGMPSTLFVVGDDKQSIYRFREANYRLIENVKQKMEKNLPAESCSILTLNKNYRSAPEIVGAVNKVFTALWGEAYRPSEVERKDHKGSVQLIELLPASNDKSSSLTEAEILAAEIRSLIENRTTIFEKSLESSFQGNEAVKWIEREAGYRDCAILIQSRTRLKEYEAALQNEGIPYRVVGGIGFYEEDEIQALMNILSFLWNQDDKLALAAALQSPLFGLTDKDIFDLIHAGRNIVDALKNRRPNEWSLLHNWIYIAGLVPLSSLIHKIVSETGAYVRFSRKSPQAIFNIDKLLDTAREFDRRGYTTLQDFVQWVKNIRQTEQGEATADMNLPGFQGFVSIMTVHKAKGLEYPVVFLPGMNQQPKSLLYGPLAIIEDTNGIVRMAVRNDANPVYDELWEREFNELLREHQRLLYVAMTRARDRLVMIGTLNSGRTPIRQNTWLDYLHQTIPMFQRENGEGGQFILKYDYPDFQAQVYSTGTRVSRPLPRQATDRAYKIDAKTVLDNLSPAQRSESLEWKKATDFIDQEKEDSIENLSIQADTRAVSPLTRGSILHRCLEEYTTRGEYDLESIITRYPDIVAFDNETRQSFIANVNSILHAVLNKKELQWIFERNVNAYSELPFLYKRGHALISGVIDRLVIKEGTGFVIDYKAIFIEHDADLSSWMDHYKPQIQIYCEAVKEIFGLQSVEGSLLFLDSLRLELSTEV